jgi:hypothetical protein
MGQGGLVRVEPGVSESRKAEEPDHAVVMACRPGSREKFFRSGLPVMQSVNSVGGGTCRAVVGRGNLVFSGRWLAALRLGFVNLQESAGLLRARLKKVRSSMVGFMREWGFPPNATFGPQKGPKIFHVAKITASTTSGLAEVLRSYPLPL